MQELMCRHKVYGLSPRDCLKTTLFQKWQRIVAPPGELLLLVHPIPICHVLQNSAAVAVVFVYVFCIVKT